MQAALDGAVRRFAYDVRCREVAPRANLDEVYSTAWRKIEAALVFAPGVHWQFRQQIVHELRGLCARAIGLRAYHLAPMDELDAVQLAEFDRDLAASMLEESAGK